MIAKITRGVSFERIGNYVHGAGRHNEHVYAGTSGGAVIGGTVGTVGARKAGGWVAQMTVLAQTRPDIQRPCWHMSVRLDPGDRRLSDHEWAMLADELMAGIHSDGRPSSTPASLQPYVVVRHSEDHVHIVMCRVGAYGVWVGKHDARQVMAAERVAEHRLGLRQVLERGDVRPLKAGEVRLSERTGQPAARARLRALVTAVRDQTAGAGRAAFEAAVRARGVLVAANIASSTGRMNGYRFALDGHQDASGEPVWFRASQLDKRLSWANLAPVIEPPPVQAPLRAAQAAFAVSSRQIVQQPQTPLQRPPTTAPQRPVRAPGLER